MTISELKSYGHSFEIKVLYSLLNDKTFLQNIQDVLTSDHFENPAQKWIVDFILSYYSRYHTYPTMEVLSVETKKEKNDVLRVAIKEELKQAYTTTAQDIEYVKQEFFTFCKNQALKEALLTSVNLLGNGQYDDIRRIVDNALKAGMDKDVGLIHSKDIESRYRDDDVKIIQFPWKIFNDITEGGLGPGDLMLLFAPPGIGKTTAVCAIASNAARQGKRVVYYTLELTDKYVSKKIDSILTGIDVKKLKAHRKEVEKALSGLEGEIIIREYSPGRASLDTIEAHLRQLKNTMDFNPDLIIIDYPELLKARKARKDAFEEANDTYTDIKGLGKDMKIPIICPSQINRQGAKDEVIEGDKVAGAFGKTMIGDFNVSLSRKRKDKISGTGRFHIMKSRLGPDGMTYEATIDMAKGFIEISEEEYDEEAAAEDMEMETKKEMKKKFLKIKPV